MTTHLATARPRQGTFRLLVACVALTLCPGGVGLAGEPAGLRLKFVSGHPATPERESSIEFTSVPEAIPAAAAPPSLRELVFRRPAPPPPVAPPAAISPAQSLSERLHAAQRATSVAYRAPAAGPTPHDRELPPADDAVSEAMSLPAASPRALRPTAGPALAVNLALAELVAQTPVEEPTSVLRLAEPAPAAPLEPQDKPTSGEPAEEVAPPTAVEIDLAAVRPIGALTASIAPADRTAPANAAADLFGALGEIHHLEAIGAPAPSFVYFWTAPALRHHPLYFEEVTLERYGHDHGCLVQPLLSGAHFYGSLAALPYKVAARPPCSDAWNLGYARPGTSVPRHCLWEPLRPAALATQAGVVVGLIFLIP